jgi:cellulose synthase/poly-beta-1,6-N-acetylglucosamine synthase-like glycosyltransferase
LLFTDANGSVAKDALKTLVRHFADPRVGCVCGSVKYSDARHTGAHQGESFYMRYDSWIKRLESRLGSVMGAFGGMFAFRREFFAPMDSMLPVDMEIPLEVLRRGARVIFEPEAVSIEPASGKFTVEFSRHARINARLFYGMERWVRKLLVPFRPFVLFAFLSKKALRWFSPFLLFALIPLSFVLDGSFYNVIALGNLILLLSAGVGAVLSWIGKSQPLFSFVLHFFVGNTAVAWGFFKFVTRRQGPTWAVARER